MSLMSGNGKAPGNNTITSSISTPLRLALLINKSHKTSLFATIHEVSVDRLATVYRCRRRYNKSDTIFRYFKAFDRSSGSLQRYSIRFNLPAPSLTISTH